MEPITFPTLKLHGSRSGVSTTGDGPVPSDTFELLGDPFSRFYDASALQFSTTAESLVRAEVRTAAPFYLLLRWLFRPALTLLGASSGPSGCALLASWR